MEPHEHEFHTEDANVEFDGEYVILYTQCNRAPVLNSYSGGEFEDTYYDYGPRCEVQKTTYIKSSDPTNVETGETLEYTEENAEEWEEIMLCDKTYDALSQCALEDFTFDSVEESGIVVEVGGVEWHVELTEEDTEISL